MEIKLSSPLPVSNCTALIVENKGLRIDSNKAISKTNNRLTAKNYLTAALVFRFTIVYLRDVQVESICVKLKKSECTNRCKYGITTSIKAYGDNVPHHDAVPNIYRQQCGVYC